MNPSTEIFKISQYLQVKKTYVNPRKIANELNIRYNTVKTNLQRLKKQGLIKNKKHVGWKWLFGVSKESAEVGSHSTWGGSQMNPISDGKIKRLAAQLFHYKFFHGLEIHLEFIDSYLVLDPPETYNGSVITLEKRKLRVMSTNDPVPLESAMELFGVLNYICKIRLEYSGPMWLTHIELNNDLPCLLDGVKRVEFGTFMGNIHRMYNKKVGHKEFLRVETIIHQKSGLVPLITGIALLGFARDFDNYLYILSRSDKITRGFMSHLTHYEHSSKELTGSINATISYLQNQIIDLQEKIESQETRDLERNELLRIISRENNISSESLSEIGSILSQLQSYQNYVESTKISIWSKFKRKLFGPP